MSSTALSPPDPNSFPRQTEPEHQPSQPQDMPADSEPSRQKARTSVRYSTYSVTAPSFAPTVGTSDSATNEIRDIATGLDRMENKALSSQRVTLSEEKTDTMHKLALGAKLDRALDRRMSSQDAVMRPRRKNPAPAANTNEFDEKAQ